MPGSEGGELVEVFRDRSLALPPLTTTLARRLMERTLIYRALQGVRGRKPVDIGALELLLVRFSQMVAEQRRIKEVDINPLFVSPDGCLALDARVALYESALPDADLPALAIRPYPAAVCARLFIYDARRRVDAHPPDPPGRRTRAGPFSTRGLSEETVHMRSLQNYLQNLDSTARAHGRLTRILLHRLMTARDGAGGRAHDGGDRRRDRGAVARNSAENLMAATKPEVASSCVQDDFQRRGHWESRYC